MPHVIFCPYLHGTVELTDERYRHILDRHPEIVPDYVEQITETVSDPDEVRQDTRFAGTFLFSRWYEDIRGGKNLMVVVVSDPAPATRHWIVTAYLSGRVRQGESVWKRS